MGECLLRVEDVRKGFGGRRVLHGVSLCVGVGEVYGLLGPNGAGKSTLLGVVVGVVEPDEGRVVVAGGSPRSPGVRGLVGYAPQEDGLVPRLTGWENLYFYASLHGLSRSEARERALPVLERLGLLEAMGRRVEGYSGGMRRKLGVAIAFTVAEKLLVLDEPTSGLDPGSKRAVWGLIEEARGRGLGVLLATHDMVEADRVSDRVGIIDVGRIVAEGPPGELKRRYGPPAAVVIELAEPMPAEAVERLLAQWRAYAAESTVRVLVEDPDRALPRIAEALAGAVRVRSIRVEEPSLEDVFLRLTGRRLGGG